MLDWSNTYFQRLCNHTVKDILKYIGCPDHLTSADTGISCRCELNNILLGCAVPRTNMSVIYSWLNHKEHRTKNFNLCTNGDELFSYDLLIGYTTDGCYKRLLNYTAPANAFVSMTTSRHINLARPYADVVMGPKKDTCYYSK